MGNAGWRRRVGLITTLLPCLVGPGTMLGASAAAHAQTDSGAGAAVAAVPTIRVAPTIVAEPETETSLAIAVVGAEPPAPRQTFIRIRGLPQSARLSDGHLVSPGIWAVPLAALSSLRLIAPLSSSGKSELTLTLVTVDGNVLSEARASLVVAPSWLLAKGGAQAAAAPAKPTPEPDAKPSADAKAPPAPVAATSMPTPGAPRQPTPPQVALSPPPAAPKVAALPPPNAPENVVRAPAPQPAVPPVVSAPRAAPLSPADRSRAEDMIKRGEAYLVQGNLAAARQFFRRAADIGHGMGALRLGGTFDPYELSAARVVGIDPDPKQAATWYERARELGIADAAQRLGRLQGRR